MKHTYYLTDRDPQPERIDIEPLDAPGRFRVTLGERTQEVDARLSGDGRLHILLDGRSLCFDVAVERDASIVRFDGHQVRVPLMDERRFIRARSRGADVDDADEVLSPMTGRVVASLVATGDTISVGQGLFIIEAMKMENEIKARREGEVAEVLVAAEDTVDEGALLLRFA